MIPNIAHRTTCKIYFLLCHDKGIYFLLFYWHLILDTFLSGAGLMDLIPRSCQFPGDINHVTQVFNMKNLGKADLIADCGKYNKSHYNNIINK